MTRCESADVRPLAGRPFVIPRRDAAHDASAAALSFIHARAEHFQGAPD
jgi:hypothetical protein